MGTHHFEVRIQRPPDEVWRYLTDFAREADWQRGVLESRHEPAGPPAAGTRKVKVRQTPFGRQRFTVEVTFFDDAGREWQDVVRDGSVAGSTGHYRVVPDGAGSRVVLDVVMRARGVARLTLPLIDRVTRTDLQGGFNRLKQVLEMRDEGAGAPT